MTLDELNQFPELRGDAFPFKGFRDFRGMPDDVYACFSAGLFRGVSLPDFPGLDCKWFGGKDRVGPAAMRLIECGITALCVPPHNQHGDGSRFYSLRFTL